MGEALLTLPKPLYYSYNQEETCKFCSAQSHNTRVWDEERRALVRLTSKEANPFNFRKPRRVKDENKDGQAVLRFDFGPAGEPEDDGGEQVKSRKVLADFAYNGTSMAVDEDGVRQYQISTKRLAELAGHTGPIFGQSNAEENAMAWAEAVTVAQYAVQMQTVLNGYEGYKSLDGVLFKTAARAVDGSFGFKVCYCFANANTSEYSSALGQLPQVRHIGKGLYTVATLVDDEDMGHLLCVAALECDVELAAEDFLWTVRTFVDDLDEDACAALRASMTAAGLASGGSVSLMEGCGFIDEESPVGEGDRNLVEAFRSTLVALHTAGVAVDMFRSAGEPLMRFPNYLSYMWYEFAVNASRVRVGFCDHCGRGFSLQGWRGRMKRLCPQCKDKAINQRNKSRLDEARRLFVEEGVAVSEIATRLYPNREAEDGCERVRHGLSTYPALKRQVKAEPSGMLAQRCKCEGIVFAARKKRGEGRSQ